MELSEAITTAVTSRYFSDEPVTDDQLKTAFDYARYAPQGGNRQPVKFVVVRDPEVRRQLAEWYLVPWKGYLAAAQTGEVGIGAEGVERVLRNADHFAENLHQVPVIVVACAELEGVHPTDTELDRLSVVGGGSIYPAVQNFLLGCREAELGAALTTLAVHVRTAGEGAAVDSRRGDHRRSHRRWSPPQAVPHEARSDTAERGGVHRHLWRRHLLTRRPRAQLQPRRRYRWSGICATSASPPPHRSTSTPCEALQLAHLRTVPFENLDVYRGRRRDGGARRPASPRSSTAVEVGGASS